VHTDSATNRVLTFEAFANAEQDSLFWYDMLPGDSASVSGIPDTRTIGRLRDDLLTARELKPGDIDILAARLLGHDGPLKPLNAWQSLAKRMSHTVAEQLTAGGNRSLRMRAQRLNYYIETLIADSPSDSDRQLLVAERMLEGMKPWDFLDCEGGAWWLTSGTPNIYRDNGSHRECWTLGLPTQIDAQPDGRLSVGSIYSNGAFLYGADGWKELTHQLPVPLVFESEGARCYLDHFGQVWRDKPRQPIGQVSCRQVHFARHFGGMLYCMDNSDYGHITIFDIATHVSRRKSVLPVQVCNDIAVVDEFFYLIDKQQGSVFKFDRSFRFLDCALGFGRGTTRLLDPVALRAVGDNLCVLSWLSGKLTVLSRF